MSLLSLTLRSFLNTTFILTTFLDHSIWTNRILLWRIWKCAFPVVSKFISISDCAWCKVLVILSWKGPVDKQMPIRQYYLWSSQTFLCLSMNLRLQLDAWKLTSYFFLQKELYFYALSLLELGRENWILKNLGPSSQFRTQRVRWVA